MAQSHNGQKLSAPDILQNQQLEMSLSLDHDGFSVVQDTQEDDPLDMQEVSKQSVFITKTQLQNEDMCMFQFPASACAIP